MDKVLDIVAKLIKNLAVQGAGFRSIGFSYEPEIPEELQ